MKRYLFVTGTRADFGKIKSVLLGMSDALDDFDVELVVTGMHLLSEFGNTKYEIDKFFSGRKYEVEGQRFQENMTAGFARFSLGFLDVLKVSNPDFVVVHGDRFDALGAAIASSNEGIPVVHIEGGEVSGTIDEAIRHSISKFSHVHLVSNEIAKKRVAQLGEDIGHIYVTGSPETDIFFSDNLPTLEATKLYYDIDFESYAIFCFHPVTTEFDSLEQQISSLISFASSTELGIIWIYPNNDKGGAEIIDALNNIDLPNVRLFESLRFENYITLLKNAVCIVGNSSSGVREAPLLGVPCINVGSRQQGRVSHELIQNCKFEVSVLNRCLHKILKGTPPIQRKEKIDTSSTAKILKVLRHININPPILQKRFIDV